MNVVVKVIILCMSFVFYSIHAFAAETPTRDDVEAFVKEAVAFAKDNGKEKFLNEVRSSSGKFHFKAGANKNLYIFVYDEKGVVMAHGVRLELTGKNRWDDKDPDGKYWIRDWTDLVHKSGSGWISYKEYNPADNNRLMDKMSFVELIDGMVVGSGMYAK